MRYSLSLSLSFMYVSDKLFCGERFASYNFLGVTCGEWLFLFVSAQCGCELRSESVYYPVLQCNIKKSFSST